jgi:antitoxin HicB
VTLTLDEYMALKYPILIEPGEESGFIATYPDLPGVIAWGETHEEVEANAEELREEWIRGNLERGWPVPLPNSSD